MNLTEIKLQIKDCSEYPHSKITKVYTSDNWDDIRKIHCKKEDKDVAEYLDWNDKNPPVPDWCPLKIA